MALRIAWSDEARADIRSLDRATAMHIFEGVYRYAATGEGRVKPLRGAHGGKLRLRVGDYRVFFQEPGEVLHILRVKNRRDAYR
jgi:mRNA-degrading endonuclease RelE of RelBE toxin-antitoxin system